MTTSKGVDLGPIIVNRRTATDTNRLETGTDDLNPQVSGDGDCRLELSPKPQLSASTSVFPHRKQVGAYLIGKTIGEGSFAKVKEGLHVLTGEKVTRCDPAVS